MATYNKVCKVCEKKFVATNANAAYCSDECRIVGKREMARLRYMKKIFQDAKKTPADKNHKDQKTIICSWCGKEFVRKKNEKYCSQSCAWKAKQQHSQRKSKPQLSANGTLCWHCEWATGKEGKCPWVRSFTPVPGWTAKQTYLRQTEGQFTESYIVKDCPLFKEG